MSLAAHPFHPETRRPGLSIIGHLHSAHIFRWSHQVTCCYSVLWGYCMHMWFAANSRGQSTSYPDCGTRDVLMQHKSHSSKIQAHVSWSEKLGARKMTLDVTRKCPTSPPITSGKKTWQSYSRVTDYTAHSACRQRGPSAEERTKCLL